ncbi:MAG TPA: DNA translocase FtsK 4TM domain-containing protein [Chthonomonadaceae bacterium]|nr:DNA translocase FtsK 4TM domain-containing protein [Chthonomonadaceae bacterium]
MVKVQRSRGSVPEAASRPTQDICGLLLFFCGAAGLLCLTWPQPGLLPALADHCLRLLAGTGAYVIPVLFMIIGTYFLIGYDRFSFSHSSFGLLLLFLVFVTWRHLALVPDPSHWQSAQVLLAGGWIGALFGSALHTLFGITISYLFLLTLTTVAVVLMRDQPFIELARQVWMQSRRGAQAAGRGLERGVQAGAALLPARKESKPVPEKRPAPALPGGEGRRERAARVVERALVPARAAQSAEEDPEPPEGKGFNLFSLTRAWRGKEDDADLPVEATPPAPPVKAERNGGRESAAKSEAAAPKAKNTPPDATAPAPAASPVTPIVFVLPPLTLLKESPPAPVRRSQAELTDKVHIIEQTLEQFNIGANVVEVASGPSVTRYEIQLAPGIKVSKIVSLADNLAMSLAAIDVRVEAPIPGKSAIGVEVPNTTPIVVSLRECLDTDEFRDAPSKLTFALGKDVAGQYKYADLAKMPHLLIGGSTNSGKSVCLNSIIASLVYRATPREVQLLMLDPKRVELSLWDGIPNLMHPVVKDVRQAAGIFRAALKEMDRRYDLFSALGTRNIDGYNQRVPESERLPYIVLIVDELADLMMQQGPEIETSICRLAQLARATGIHLVIATQRPSVDVITGTIKANISSRIAFAVASQVDSRTILDMNGAERLIGRGDMLFMPIDAAKPVRIQGCYLSESETNALVEYLKEQEQPNYTFSVAEVGGGDSKGGAAPEDEVDDAFFEQAVRLVVNNGQASTSMLQRRFRIGYTRAARIVELMEEKGIVGPLNGAKPREILVSKDEVERMFNPAHIPGVDDYQDEG